MEQHLAVQRRGLSPKVIGSVAVALMVLLAVVVCFSGNSDPTVTPTQLGFFDSFFNSFFQSTPTCSYDNYPGMPNPTEAPVQNRDLPPWVFITGLTDTKLYATLTESGPPDSCGQMNVLGDVAGAADGEDLLREVGVDLPGCSCRADTYLLYPSIEQVSLWANCFLRNMGLNWDFTSRHIVPIEGVNISVQNGADGYSPNGVGMGSGSSMMPPPPPAKSSFPSLANCPGNAPDMAYTSYQAALIGYYGYSMAQFRTIVWDWRLGPNEWLAPEGSNPYYQTGNFARDRRMIEELSAENNNRPVFIMSISEGGPYFKAFLDHQTQAWKDRYIQTWFSYSGVWAGSSDMAWSQMSGLPFYPGIMESVLGFATFTSDQFRHMTAAMPGMAFVSPVATVNNATANAEILFETPTQKYTYAQMSDALHDAGLEVTASVFDNTPMASQSSPGVLTMCWHGSDYPTPTHFVYNFTFDGTYRPQQPSSYNANGNGDGTVHIASLRVCEAWDDTTVQTFPGQSHVGILVSTVTHPEWTAEVNRVLGLSNTPNWTAPWSQTLEF